MSMSEKAILIALEISAFSITRTDYKVTQKAINDAHAKQKSGKFHKRLILSDVYNKYKNVENRARTYLEERTSPFMGKMKVLPIVELEEVQNKLREFRFEAEALRDEFIDGGDYEASVKDAKNHLGSMYNPDDYPDPEVVRSKFRFNVSTMPMPEGKGYLPLDLEQESLDELEEELEQSYVTAHKNLTVKLLQRIRGQVEHMAEKLSGEEKHLKWTLVQNMRDMVDMLPELNIHDDPDVSQLIDSVRDDLCQFTVKEMRDDPSKLSNTRNKAKALNKKLDAQIKKMAMFAQN